MKAKLWLLAILFVVSMTGLVLAEEDAGTMAVEMNMDDMQMNMDMNAVTTDEAAPSGETVEVAPFVSHAQRGERVQRGHPLRRPRCATGRTRHLLK